MKSLRRLILDHRRPAFLLLLLVLAIRALVPAGFMPVMSAGGIVMTICSGSGTRTMVMPASEYGQPAKQQPAAKDSPCAFTALGAPGLAAADPILLAQAVLFAAAIILWLAAPAPRPAALYLRPPTRGPPLTA